MSTKRAREKARAIRLRLSGKSYNEIRKILNIRSKGTISYWLKGLQLPSLAVKRLEANVKRAHDRGLLKFNTDRTSRIIDENRQARKVGYQSIGRLTKRELLLVGAALYWGEGTKSTTRLNSSLSFANSDPKMIALFMRFLREIVQVPEERIRAGFHLYKTASDQQGRTYWAHVTKLPPDRFYVVRQISKASLGKRNPRLLPFGTAVIRVNDRRIFQHVCGMIDALSTDKRHIIDSRRDEIFNRSA